MIHYQLPKFEEGEVTMFTLTRILTVASVVSLNENPQIALTIINVGWIGFQLVGVGVGIFFIGIVVWVTQDVARRIWRSKLRFIFAT